MKKTIASVGVGIAAIAALTLAGCSASPASNPTGSSGGNDFKLAAVLPNTSDPFFQTISCGAAAKAKELGVDLQQFNSTTADTNTIASNFQSASLTSPDGMLVTPFIGNQFVAQYTKLMSDGVPVVTGSGTDPQVDYKYIFSSTETAQFADQVKDLIPDGSGTMVYLGGAPGIPVLETRTTPFVKAVEAMRTDLKPLEPVYSGFDTNKSTTAVASLLLANPDLKLIIAADGPDAVGAAAAIKQAGKSGKVTLIAFDAVPAEVDALRDGTVTALIAQDPYTLGAKSIETLVDYLKAHPEGGAVKPDGQEMIPNHLLTAKNVDDPANKNYLYQAKC
jgi:ribose transport system substrate-binding protein